MLKFSSELLTMIAILLIWSSNGFSKDKKYDKILSEEQLPYLLDGSNAGTLYYITFHPCWEENAPNNTIRIYVSSAVKTKVTLEIKDLGIIRIKETIPNDIIEFILKPSEAQAYSKGSGAFPIPPEPEQIWKGRAIKISSEAPIIVYGVTRFTYTSDGFLALPVTSLGRVYQVASYADPTNNTSQYLPSYTSIVGVYDSTLVVFRLGGCESCRVPKEDGDTLKTGKTIIRTINEGDVWLIPGIGQNNDLTGSKIIATKPVSVISGNFCAYIPTNVAACDYIIEQELPQDTWGSKIYVSPIVSRKKPSIIKIFAKNLNTQVNLDGIPMWKILTPGGVWGKGYIEARAGSSDIVKPVIVQSANGDPINVVQYNPGQQDDNVPSDPFQMQLTPIEQFQNEIVFNTPGIRGGLGFTSNYINIVYKATKDRKVPEDVYFGEIIDGKLNWTALKEYSSNPGNPFDKDTPDENGRIHYCKTIKLPKDGVYKIKSGEKFAAYAYGFGDYDSYGFPTSVAALALARNDTIPPAIVTVNDNEDGELSGEIIDEPAYDSENRSNLSLIFMDPTTSENFKFTTEKYIANVDYKVKWKLTKIDPLEPSKAHLVINDRNGNRFDTIITYQGIAPNYRRSDSLALVAVYKKNNGENWTKKLNWLSSKTLENWEGVTISNNRVSELDLSGRGLSGNLAEEFFNLFQLKILDLSNNPSLDIPSLTSKFLEIEYANLSNCAITIFPSFLTKSNKLVELNLSNNLLSSIAQGIENIPTLKKIDISNNRYTFSDLSYYKDFVKTPSVTFIYYPQQKFGKQIESKVGSADSYTIDFGINVSTNDACSWELNGVKINGKTTKTLTINNFDKENVGTYNLLINNSDLPLLTLESQECNLTIITGKPIITTNSIYDITENSAKIDVKIKNTGGDDIQEKGVCWNNEGNATIANNKKEFKENTKSFSLKIDMLKDNKVYYLRSYAINNNGISYSQEKSFKTSITSVDEDLINGIKFVRNENNIIISLVDNENIEYKLLDLNGNLISSGNNGSSKEIIIPTINMAKGVYFIELSGTTTHLSKKIIID